MPRGGLSQNAEARRRQLAGLSGNNATLATRLAAGDERYDPPKFEPVEADELTGDPEPEPTAPAPDPEPAAADVGEPAPDPATLPGEIAGFPVAKPGDPSRAKQPTQRPRPEPRSEPRRDPEPEPVDVAEPEPRRGALARFADGFLGG